MPSTYSRKLLFALVFLLCYTISYSQNPNQPYKDISIASPTAGSLGKFADIPVSYHTGIPQVNIPIYTIKSGNLELPVNISYHASGLKASEPASWVGAGFALDAGGVITRSVMGGPDEKNTNPGFTQLHGHFSEYGYNSYLYDSLGDQDWKGFAEGKKDGEPDLFFFNFGGYSGKFYFSDDRTPVLLPETDIKIEYTYVPGFNNSIESFLITTPDGVKYYFGKTPSTTDVDPVEKTLPYSDQDGLGTGNIISSWFLNKIVSPDEQFSIDLSYQAENYGYHTISMYPLDGITQPGSPLTREYKLMKNIVQGVRLSQITFPNGTVTFEANTAREDLSSNVTDITDNTNVQSKRLDAISISNGTGFCKKFSFAYNYFIDNTSPLPGHLASFYASIPINTDRKRLKLESITEQSCDASVVNPPHVFTYFSEFVPRRLTFGLDHWGYYNGVTTNDKLIPTFTINNGTSVTTVDGANRDASWPAMRGGALQKISYPTGGHTAFDLEPNNTFTNTTSYVLVTAAALVNNMYGQSQITHTVPFTVSGVEGIKITVQNTSTNWSPTLIIKNSSNVEVYNSFWVPVSTTINNDINLPEGSYQATLAFPSNSQPNLIGGAVATISQWQYVTNSTNQTIGGLRIKTMTHNDGGVASSTVTTSYSYLFGAQSSAELYSRPVYVQTVRNDLIRDVGYWTTNGFMPYTLGVNGCLSTGGTTYYKSPSSIRPMATTQGYHIGYSQVKVSQAGNGYSLYEYYGSSPWPQSSDGVAVRTINTSICDPTIPNYPAAPLPHDFMRGELKHEWHYNEQGELLKDIYYVPVYQNSPFTTPGFIVTQRYNGVSPQLLGTHYTLSTARKTQTQVTETIYTPGAGSKTTTSTAYYESPYHRQQTRSTTTNSWQETMEAKTKYAFDFIPPACAAISDCSAAYNSSMATYLAQYNTQRAACSTAACLTTAYLTYRQNQTNARISYINCRRTSFTNTTNAYKTAHDNAKAAANTELKPLLELQDLFINAPIESTGRKAGLLVSAAYTRYDYSSNPATKVYPSLVQTIKILTPTSAYTNSAISSNAITKDSRFTDETFLKFYQGNLVEVKKKDGVFTSYIWGHNNTLPVVKATGVDFITLQTAYNAVSGNLSALRNQASLSNALLNTYGYIPLVGMISETGTDNRTTSYEYDALKRLLRIRDFNNQILKQYNYQYQVNAGSVVYTNTVQSGTFTRNNCGVNYTGSQVVYTVAAGTYSSSVSQAAANTLAQNDVSANGQAYANANGTCTYTGPMITIQGYNNKSSSLFVKFVNNTTENEYMFGVNSNTSTPYTIGSVPPGTYTVYFYIGSPVAATYNINGFTQFGSNGATFYNISITSTSTASRY